MGIVILGLVMGRENLEAARQAPVRLTLGAAPLPRADCAHEAQRAEGGDDQGDDRQPGADNAGDCEHDPNDPDRSRDASRDHQLISASFARPAGRIAAAFLKLAHIGQGSEPRESAFKIHFGDRLPD